MALIGNNADTLLNGLSSFWHRFFRDIGDIQAVYEGTEILLGQVYLNLLSDVLNTSLVEAPLFRKEYYKLITVREDQLVFHEHGNDLALPATPMFYGNPGTDRYVYTSDTLFGAIPTLQDTIFTPKAALEPGVDYKVAGGELQFIDDPTDPVLPGYAHRRVTVEIGGKFTAPGVNWVAAAVEKGDTIYFSETLELGVGSTLNVQDTARAATIVQVTADKLSVSANTPLPTFPAGTKPAGFSWRIMRKRDDGVWNPTLPRSTAGVFDGQVEYVSTLEVSELSFWAVDAKIDDLTLYNTYGYFFTRPQLSSESYRALLRGLMQLYILGPAMARLESALNLTAGLPTVREESEVLAGYDSGVLATGLTGTLLAGNVFQVPVATFTPVSLGGYVKITVSDFAANIGTFNIVSVISATQVVLKPLAPFIPDAGIGWVYTQFNKQTVTTDKNTYEYPLETPVRADVKDPGNNGILTFRAFEALTTAIVVTDYIQDPEWWHTIKIPASLMPDAPDSRRTVTPQLYDNVIGPNSNVLIGDPGYYIGADEDLHVVAKPYRHNAAFILVDRFLKTHLFAVLVDPSVALTGLLISDLQKILTDVKPVHTALYFRPIAPFQDAATVLEQFRAVLTRLYVNHVQTIDNQWRIGGTAPYTTWNIGDQWQFATGVGGSITLGTGAGFQYVAIGGTDPNIQPADPGNVPGPDVLPYAEPISWIDRPLYVYMHP